MEIRTNDFIRVLAVVVGLAFVLISIAYGFKFMFDPSDDFLVKLPMPPYFLLLVFSVGFVLGSVFFENRGAEFPWHLVGGAVASLCFTFLLAASVGGVRYIYSNGLSGLGLDNIIYAISISIIVSMILLNLVTHKL